MKPGPVLTTNLFLTVWSKEMAPGSGKVVYFMERGLESPMVLS